MSDEQPIQQSTTPVQVPIDVRNSTQGNPIKNPNPVRITAKEVDFGIPEDSSTIVQINGLNTTKEGASPQAEPVTNHIEDNEDYTSHYEEQAKELGWRPKSEWKGNKADWRDAKTYLDMTSFYKRIDADKKLIEKQNKMTVQILKSAKLAEERAREAERQLVIHELRVAEANGDVARYKAAEARAKEIDAKYDDSIKQQEELLSEYEQPKEVDTNSFFETPHFKLWQKMNPWFRTDEELTNKALDLSKEWAANNKGKLKGTEAEIEELNYIQDNIRKIMHKPRDTTEEKVAEEKPVTLKVASPDGGRVPKSSKTTNTTTGLSLDQRINRLPLEQKQVAKYLKNNNFDVETYITLQEKQLKK